MRLAVLRKSDVCAWADFAPERKPSCAAREIWLERQHARRRREWKIGCRGIAAAGRERKVIDILAAAPSPEHSWVTLRRLVHLQPAAHPGSHSRPPAQSQTPTARWVKKTFFAPLTAPQLQRPHCYLYQLSENGSGCGCFGQVLLLLLFLFLYWFKYVLMWLEDPFLCNLR